MKRLVGAGVMCVSRHPVDDEIVILLGREKEVPGWKQGSLKWCGFSGRSEEGESAVASAVREFVEESCCCVRLSPYMPLPVRQEDVTAELEKAPFFSRSMKVHPQSEALLCHVTYLCRIPFDASVVDRFRRTHAELLELDRIFKSFHKAKKSVEHLPRAFLPGYVLADKAVTVDLRGAPETGRVEVDFFDGVGDESCSLKTWHFRTSTQTAKEAQELHRVWRTVTAFVSEQGHREIFRHPAVLLSSHGQKLVSAYVNRCYLEKTELAWFRLRDIEATDRWWSKETFRRHFIDNIRQLSDQIRGLFGDPPLPRGARLSSGPHSPQSLSTSPVEEGPLGQDLEDLSPQEKNGSPPLRSQDHRITEGRGSHLSGCRLPVYRAPEPSSVCLENDAR
jgi:hypothetical protein